MDGSRGHGEGYELVRSIGYDPRMPASRAPKTREDHRGELNPAAKLTWEKVEAIRLALAVRPKRSQADIAREFGICQVTVSNIKRGRSWANRPVSP